MENKGALESTSQLVAHLLREIESALRDVLLPVATDASDQDVNRQGKSWKDVAKEILQNLKDKVQGCLQEVEKINSAISVIDPYSQITEERDTLRNVREEITQILRKIEDELDYIESSSHKKQIKKILQALDIDENAPEAKAWFELAERLHSVAHRRRLERPRPAEEVRDLWKNSQILLEVVISGIRERLFLKWFPILDDLLTRPQPTKKDIKRLANEIPNNAVMRGYFFERLDNPKWLKPLWKRGFFRHPPEPVRSDEEGTIRFPPWPEARYLARMAEYKPELVAQIIQEMLDTDNVAVHSDLLDAVLRMPPDVSVQLADKVKRWAESPHSPLAEKCGQLIAHWAKGGKTDEALEIASVLLDVLPDRQRAEEDGEGPYQLPTKPRARFDDWHYRQILKQHYSELVQVAGLPALELLCDLLEKAVRLSLNRKEGEGPEDYSYIWRPAIEDHAQNLGHTVKDALVAAVRDTAVILVQSGKASVEQVIETLENRRWKVLQRIALHVLRIFADQAISLVAARLTDWRFFDDPHVWHEYVLLLRECFGKLTEEDRQTILGWISAGPNIEEFKKQREKRTGSPPTEEEITRYCELWQRNRLAWIGLDGLPEEWQERYQVLVKKHGEPEHPEFISYSRSWIGPVSPKTAEELKAMSVEEIVEFLKTWMPPRDIFGEPSPEGLGRELSSVVMEDPARFATAAQSFQGLDPTYVRALIFGLHESLKQQKTFDWASVLQLCQWVVEQPREIPGRQVKHMDADPDWGWTRKAIADLLSTGFEDRPGTIPIDLREKVWRVLQPLTDDPEPTPEYEKKYGGTNMDPATLSINTTRGAAIHAVVRYALWVRRYFEKQSSQGQPERGLAEMPEVREVLNAHLDVSQEPSLAIRAVYGQWFPWLVLLDTQWAREKAGQIFPLDEQEQAYFDAAWNTYVAFCRPYNDVFEILRDQYYHAVHRVGSHENDSGLLADPDIRLAEHLMEFYWRGKLGLDDPLLSAFWKKASDDLRAHALGFVGRALMNTTDPTEILERLKMLWEARLEVAKQAPANHMKEMSAFGWWFVSGKFKVSWAITQLVEALHIARKAELDHMVVEKLSEVAVEYPLKAMQCLKLMVEGDYEGWNIYTWREHLRKILGVALQNPSVREEAESVINYLGSRGYLEFRDLLP
ncbi:MAG TPA: hypothetical protein ENF32_00330 [Thermosulfidibacter takaii]|uniref:Uncharacterized protein n=1 Tax=Thermosulfidibacter takaii TaxID=412593 RepID=A0A7C0U5G4_9BACT|nr:hypothetical protein [Thermosulfidibacter takaii]